MGIKNETKIGLWNRWLKSYWVGRYQGIPVPLTNGELLKMVGWVSELEPVFPEVVEIICNGQIPHFEHISLFWRLEKNETNIINQHANDLAKLLECLTSGGHMPEYLCDELQKLTEKLIFAKASAVILRRLCENLATIGCARALELSSMIS
jgi:hypothetical protein